MEYETQAYEWQQPEVSPQDVWGDPPWMSADLACGPCVLPARRIKPVNGNALQPANGGFMIETRPPAVEGPRGAVFAGLEVSEINGRVLRLEPETATVERVPRQEVAFQPLAVDEHRRRAKSADKSGEWGRANRHALYWVAGAGILVMVLVVWAVAMLPRVNRPNTIHHRPGEVKLVVDQDVDDEEPARISRMQARQGEARQVFERVTSASTLQEIQHLLREPQDVLPLIQDPALFAGSPIFQQDTDWTARIQSGLIYGLLEGTREDFSKFRAYFIEQDGALLMDWKASMAYGSATFAELQKGSGDAREIRGWVAPMDYYNLAYPEDGYQSFSLLSADEEQTVWIYAKRGSEVSDTLELHFRGGQIMRGNRDAGKMTLRLARGPETSLPNQWLLVELLHKEWIAP